MATHIPRDTSLLVNILQCAPHHQGDNLRSTSAPQGSNNFSSNSLIFLDLFHAVMFCLYAPMGSMCLLDPWNWGYR